MVFSHVTQVAKPCFKNYKKALNPGFLSVTFNQSFYMRFKLSLLSVSLLLMCVLLSAGAQAQLPSDLSRVKSSQITDAQLMQFIQQAEAGGADEADLMQDFQKRGLPEAELQALSARVKALMGASGTKQAAAQDAAPTGSKRIYKGTATEFKRPETPSRVFGSELFSGADPLFVPNLKLATPKGYVVGPEDELQLDVYGNNISSQKLTVSPDGFVNVKYAGLVNVNGLSIEQALGILRSRLLKYYPSLASGGTKIALTLGSVRSIQVMVVGAVKKPGTITLPSIATLFNALYASGGPVENGSFRNIELVRDNKVIATADLYDFMLKGDQQSNLALRDNDVIRVPFARLQVALDGALNRTGIFEVKEKENLSQALDFAGGFRSNAFRGRIAGTRFTDRERKIIDIGQDNFGSFALQHGDSLYVENVVDRFVNRVSVSGAVFKPGAYALEKEMDMKALIEKAEGLKEDAFTGRVSLVRMKEDRTKEYLSYNLKNILSGAEVVGLKREDSLHVLSVLELRDVSTVKVLGLVRNPGDFRFEDSLTLQAVLLQAGGFLEDATPKRIEVGRRNSSVNPGEKGAETSEIIQVDMNKDLAKIGADIYLKPFDVISVRLDPTKIKQITVKLSGEVLYAGSYTLSNPEERLSSVLQRAGGTLPYADLSGAKLIRKKAVVDSAEIKRLALSNIDLSDVKASDSSKLMKNYELNSLSSEVAIDLGKIMTRPGSQDDLSLQDGDELIIPKFINTVAVGGEVLKPVTVQFEEGRGLGRYLSAAGGFTRNAYKSRAFVVYANGRSSKTHSFLGIRSYPKVKPGSSIFVPIKPEGKGFDPAKAGVLVSAFSAIMTAIILITR